MKIRPLLAVCALTLLMPACSSMDHKTASAPSYNDGYDHAYMAKIERQAESTGTQIIWVNPPQAKQPVGHN
jgi:hypothetical protein